MDCDSSLPDDIIPVTPDIQKSKKSKKRRKKWICSGSTMMPQAEGKILMQLNHPVCTSVNKVYVFHSFKEVLTYNSKRYPINNYLKIIGQYKTSQCHIPYLHGYDINDKKFTVFLNMKTLETMPKLDEVIEVFGHLDFQTVMKKDLPIVVVHFFKSLDGNIFKYINCLRRQKIFVPENCLQLSKEPERLDDSLVDFLHNLSMSIISIEGE